MTKLAGLILAGAMVGSGSGACAAADTVPRVGFSNLQNRRIEGPTSVVAKGAGAFEQLDVLVTVGVDGRVVEAEPADNHWRLDPAPALAAVRQWRFRPPRFDGKPVIAIGTVPISYGPPERAADASAPFPSAPPADVEIMLARGPCFFGCPAYEVGIKGDGTVRFSTDDGAPGTKAGGRRPFLDHNVLLPGTHVAHVDSAVVARLVEKFRAAHFFGLKPRYVAQVTDQATKSITFRAGKTSKQVVEYAGWAADMPADALALERAVDDAAGTDRWVYGNVETAAELERDGIDPHSQDAADLATDAMLVAPGRDRNAQAGAMVAAMLDKGLPLDAMVDGGVTPDGSRAGLRREGKLSLGAVLAYDAATAGDEPLFERLDRLGWTARMGPDRLDAALAAGAGCSPTIARALVHAGANPHVVGKGAALAAIRDGSGACRDADEAHVLDMARTLIALGVPVDARDDLGWTALMGCGSPELARLLLAHGADPNALGTDGETAVLATDDDRVALVLLRAGANPRAKDKDGTLREHAIADHMPATLAWLDAHGIK
ncbi:MAG TPA: DUF6438 domain-containing protein [Allosphingosinicella sp.]|nr:DUF6438 domain-containing protein [Allosphingosinicella sp.]